MRELVERKDVVGYRERKTERERKRESWHGASWQDASCSVSPAGLPARRGFPWLTSIDTHIIHCCININLQCKAIWISCIYDCMDNNRQMHNCLLQTVQIFYYLSCFTTCVQQTLNYLICPETCSFAFIWKSLLFQCLS